MLTSGISWVKQGKTNHINLTAIYSFSIVAFHALSALLVTSLVGDTAHCHVNSCWRQAASLSLLLLTVIHGISLSVCLICYLHGCITIMDVAIDTLIDNHCLAVPTRFSCSFTYAVAQINQPEDEVLKMRIWKILWLLSFDYGRQTASFFALLSYIVCKQKLLSVGKAKGWHVFDQMLLLRAAIWVSETKFSDEIELKSLKRKLLNPCEVCINTQFSAW